ncbi:hypothetical protein SAMN04487977_10836 [Treponema bryantii]|uniref:Fibronectin type-III domain-containing protein n=1 Tax=Treponema bryantii TaxID=163 RepID=A0A1H9HYM0_9SPIR|nr:hypothetical protein [Treponema bryantii]SEQ67357.1 hypothetical protein SAMN04487977_10836 [Treponema bryantii]
MKKRLVKFAAAALSAAAILTLAGCKNTPDFNVSSEIDTVLNLAAPEVKVTAYPGMNFVSWSPVANAYGYVLYIYEEGNHIKTQNGIAYTTLNYSDTNIQNNKTYKYIVEAVSKDHKTDRAVQTENSLSSPVSVKAIVPSYETSPLELYNFESGSKNADYVVSAENINVYKDAEDTIAVSFPGKAYLKYDVYYSMDNAYETLRNNDSRNSVSSALSKASANDSILHASRTTITTSGKYHFIVDAKAANEKYGKTDTVISEKTVEVETLAGSGASITTSNYKTPDTIRVVFTGFTSSLDGSILPAECYKLYRSVNYNPATPVNNMNFKVPTLYTPVNGEVKATDISGRTFFVDDAIEDNSVAYTYTLVVTDGTRYAEMNNSTRRSIVAGYALSTIGNVTISGTKYTLDNDDYNNDIEWTIKLPEEGITIDEAYFIERLYDESYIPVAADFARDDDHKVTVLTAGDATGKVYKAFTKNHTPGSYVYLLVSLSKEGYKDKEVVSSSGVSVNMHYAGVPTFTAELYDNKVDGATAADYKYEYNDVVLNIKHTLYEEMLDDFTYTIYEAHPEINQTTGALIWDFETADWTIGDVDKEFKKAGFKKNSYDDSAAAEYVAFVELKDLAPGNYAWKLVTTEKESGVSYSIIQVKTVEGVKTDSIKFVPFINVERDNPKQPSSANTVTFTKSNTFKRNYGTTGVLDGYLVSVTPETTEDGVTYTLYRTTSVATSDMTKVVWTKVGPVVSKDPITQPFTCYELDSNGQRQEKEPESYPVSLKYTYNDAGLSTGDGYSYVVVCEKEGCATRYSNVAPIAPVN